MTFCEKKDKTSVKTYEKGSLDMKIKRTSKMIALLCSFLTCSIFLASCSSENPTSLQVLVGGPYIDSQAYESCTESLLTGHPQWQAQETPVSFLSISFGDPESDPYAGANIAKVSAMVAAQEIDLMICDTDNAARFARSDMFAPVQSILSEEQLTAYQDRLLTFEKVDDEGNLTGEFTEACGIALSGNAQLDALYGDQEYGIFLVGNADPMESAKQIFLDIAEA